MAEPRRKLLCSIRTSPASCNSRVAHMRSLVPLSSKPYRCERYGWAGEQRPERAYLTLMGIFDMVSRQ